MKRGRRGKRNDGMNQTRNELMGVCISVRLMLSKRKEIALEWQMDEKVGAKATSCMKHEASSAEFRFVNKSN